MSSFHFNGPNVPYARGAGFCNDIQTYSEKAFKKQLKMKFLILDSPLGVTATYMTIVISIQMYCCQYNGSHFIILGVLRPLPYLLRVKTQDR